jgi:hypothetical protein
MTEFLIDSLFRVDGYDVPSNASDGSGNVYTTWELLDRAAFNITVPTGYTAGTDLELYISESTPSASDKHKWQVDVTLAGAYTETFTSEVTSSATANTISSRTITVSTSGTIQSQAIAEGDLVSFQLSRIAASSDEDSASIKIYSITVATTTTDGISVGSRLGTLIRQVLRKFNDDDQQHLTQSQILDWVNECIQDISGHEYWTTSGTIDIVADQTSYDLLTLFPTIMDIESVVWEATDAKLIPVSTWDQYVKLLAVTSSSTTPYCYFLQSNTLFIIPTPSASTTAGVTIYYSYCPAALDFSTNTDIPLPKSFDSVIQAYCLMCAYARDRHAPMAADMLRMNKAAYEKGVARLLAQTHPSGFRMRGYR